MEIGPLDLRDVRLPGAAGDLQAAGAKASLIKELGDNYARYHAFLSEEWRKLGSLPDPTKFEDFSSYATALARFESVVHAEATLRRCEAYRRRGARLTAPLDLRVPLVADDMLVGIDPATDAAEPG